MNILMTAAGGMSGIAVTVGYLVIIIAFFYFAMMRPQKKEQQRLKAMYDALEVGDTVLTNSGFYGIIIAIEDDTVIVEFGNNKNCRIPMQKTAIAQVEKSDASAS